MDLERLILMNLDTVNIKVAKSREALESPTGLQVAMCSFPTVKDGADVAIAAMISTLQLSRVELLDEVVAKDVNLANRKDFPEAPTLMLEFIGAEAYTHEQAPIVQKIASEHSGLDFVFAQDLKLKRNFGNMLAIWSLTERVERQLTRRGFCVPRDVDKVEMVLKVLISLDDIS
ncbi:hypothetical protein CTI12_AA087450 [Artemisia annua]|uniref:FAD-binding oxidoreductase/transferase type 4 C-terminal domain-containing protein n=1 Tax=Artemisia annua TaxID=35608 RepID=A0A2U1PSG7_ARTAN|nr:hypothetical protein CTI12_AA087450 [Artemisia annua]